LANGMSKLTVLRCSI